MRGSLYMFLINLMLRIPNLKSVSVHYIRFLNNTQFCIVNEEDNKSIPHCVRYINFVGETSSRAHFEDNFAQLKNWKRNYTSKIACFFFMRGGITNMGKSRGFIDFILPPSYKIKKKKFRAIVLIQFLIYIKFPLK